ncbi:ABC transporter permease [Gimesia chilikensis]|uniref:Ribose transport system permease protein RbsC n=1 Tax=Gimesia chilikensis TaxID=2605989 RepID=A0A517PYR4_9PLAN|nr:ABC transporter permease [Gimesia chilikensis]MCR9234277.1 ABC transporter permease [bacterium]QDT24530.1 Ribose transport system permease protein RbsC [Gimesia chilikensis]QDT88220.1 Ribose transport system permease protein RbsC [Gimesia chilikensis]
MKVVKQMVPLLAAIIILLLLFRIWVPSFLTPENMLNLTQQISVNTILALGMTLVILVGGIDLSVGAMVALVGTTTVYCLTALSGDTQDPFMLLTAILAGLGVASLFGVFHGIAAAKTAMPPFIITLASMLIARGCALRFNGGLPMPIKDEQTWFLAIGNGRLFDVVPYPVVIMLSLFLLMALLLHRTRFGQHVYALGGNREAALYTGIPIVRVEITVYLLCSLMAGVAGMIHTSQLYSAEPGSGEMFELTAIAAVVVGGTSFTGGRGTMFGTMLGAVIIGILDKGLNQAGVHYSLQYIVKGAVILVAVYLDVRRNR